jgi:DNA-binding NarL/FixJ family response regulator
VGREPVADLAQYLRAHAGGQQNAKAKSYGLTRREIEILSTIVSGLSNKEIAQKFSLSEDTGVSSRLELALFAINNRLIETV